MEFYERYPIIPMKFCTIYSGLESLKNTISTHETRMLHLLDNIADKDEWILKLYCERDKLKEMVASNNETIEAKKKEIAAMSPGRQYLENRRLHQLIDQETEKETHAFSKSIHKKLAALSVDHEVKRNWNKDVTGRQEEMCWNSVYMVDKSRINDFKSIIKKLQDKWAGSGWHFEVTGPWPSYHFAKIS